MKNVKCIRCGSTAQIKEEKVEYTENDMNIFYSCGCGTRFVRVYRFIAEFKLLNKKVEKTT